MSPELISSTAEIVAPYLLPAQPNEILVGKSRVENGNFVTWDVFSQGVYRCEVSIESEPTGGYSVHLPCLPGVVSDGDTEENALENIREALAAAIETYLADGQPIPWIDEDPEPSSGVRRWVVVHV